jgi:hypothetical protein
MMLLSSQGEEFLKEREDPSALFNCCNVSHEKRRSNYRAYKYAD